MGEHQRNRKKDTAEKDKERFLLLLLLLSFKSKENLKSKTTSGLIFEFCLSLDRIPTRGRIFLFHSGVRSVPIYLAYCSLDSELLCLPMVMMRV